MALEIVLITGMSGSGKSLALHALEDAGYYCVDNLPPELLLPFAQLEHQQHANRVALAMDVRSATALPLVPAQLEQLRKSGVKIQSLFLEASTDTLVRRFSETRRRHPLSKEELQDGRQALVQSIRLERELLADLREQSLVIDTSNLRNADLLAWAQTEHVVTPELAAQLAAEAERCPQAAAAALEQAIALREAIYAIFTAHAAGSAPAASDLALLN